MISLPAVVTALLGWQLATEVGVVNPRFASSPLRVIETLPWLFSGDVLIHGLYTAYSVVVAFVIAVVAGIVAGLALGRLRLLRRAFDPLVTVGYTTPLTAFIPVVVMIFGLGVTSKIVVGFIAGAFPVIVNVSSGVATVDPVLMRAARAFSASRTKVYRDIIVPSVMPYVATGARIGMGRVLIGVIVTEMFGGTQHGAGLLLMRMGQSFQVDRVMALVLAVGLAGTLAVAGMRRWEARAGRWRAQ